MNVFQSPIALDFKNINFSRKCSPVEYQKTISEYSFDPVKKQWTITQSQPPTLKTNGTLFTLKEFHFHQPAEHPISSHIYPIEVHFVFQDTNSNILALGFIAYKSKRVSSFFKQLVNNGSLTIPSLSDYWSYTGSLTTECTSSDPMNSQINVSWFINQQKIKITQEFLDLFVPFSKPACTVQSRSGRSITFCEH